MGCLPLSKTLLVLGVISVLMTKPHDLFCQGDAFLQGDALAIGQSRATSGHHYSSTRTGVWSQAILESAVSMLRQPFKTQGTGYDLTILQTLLTTSPTSLSALVSQDAELLPQCSQTLQFVTTSLQTTHQAIKFKAMFEKDERIGDLPICIKPIIWLASNQLTCTTIDGRKQCDLSAVAGQRFLPNYTHLVFFLDEGKAFVHNGAMYLDQADTYSVFIHELAHFAGFVDEYAVSPALAQQYCINPKASAPNLLVNINDNIENHDKYVTWIGLFERMRSEHPRNKSNSNKSNSNQHQVRYMPALPIEPSRTCNMMGVKSYKPSDELTFLEYHDTNNIPPIYSIMWKEVLTRHHQNRAVSVLFSTSAKEANLPQATLYWSKL